MGTDAARLIRVRAADEFAKTARRIGSAKSPPARCTNGDSRAASRIGLKDSILIHGGDRDDARASAPHECGKCRSIERAFRLPVASRDNHGCSRGIGVIDSNLEVGRTGASDVTHADIDDRGSGRCLDIVEQPIIHQVARRVTNCTGEDCGERLIRSRGARAKTALLLCDADRQQAAIPAQASASDAVISRGTNRPRDVNAVVVQALVSRVAVASEEVIPTCPLRIQVGVRQPPAVEHSD